MPVQFLRGFGYSVVLLPSPELIPGTLIHKVNSRFRRIGPLGGSFTPGGAPQPPVSAAMPRPDMSGKRTEKVDASFGLNFLGAFIGALGGGSLELKAKYASARSVEFQYEGVQENHLEVSALDQFMAGAQLNPSPTLRQWLNQDTVAVITSAVKCKKLSVAATASNGVELGLDVPVIQAAVGGNVHVSRQSTSSRTLTYEGNTPVVFGYQKIFLIFDHGNFKRLREAGFAPLEARRPEVADYSEVDLTDALEPGDDE